MTGILINSLGKGGAERIVISLCNLFRKDNLDFLLLSIEKQRFYKIKYDIPIAYLSSLYHIKNKLIKLFTLPLFAIRLKKYVSRYKLKKVESHLIRSNIINVFAKILGSKHYTILVNHNIISHNINHGISGKIKMRIINFFYQRADLLIYVSKEIQYDFLKTFNFSNKSLVIYNPHSVDEIIRLSKETPDFNFNPDKKYIIYFGRLIKRKNIDQLINAFSCVIKKIAEIELVILGEGPAKKELLTLVNKQGISRNVHFLSSVQNPFKYLAKSEIFVLPSEREGLPNTIIESMICKTVVVSADCSAGPREIIAPSTDFRKKLKEGFEIHEYGVLYAVNDIDSLIKCLIALLNDNLLIEKLKTNAFKIAKSYDIKSIYSFHKKLIAE